MASTWVRCGFRSGPGSISATGSGSGSDWVRFPGRPSCINRVQVHFRDFAALLCSFRLHTLGSPQDRTVRFGFGSGFGGSAPELHRFISESGAALFVLAALALTISCTFCARLLRDTFNDGSVSGSTHAPLRQRLFFSFGAGRRMLHDLSRKMSGSFQSRPTARCEVFGLFNLGLRSFALSSNSVLFSRRRRLPNFYPNPPSFVCILRV